MPDFTVNLTPIKTEICYCAATPNVFVSSGASPEPGQIIIADVADRVVVFTQGLDCKGSRAVLVDDQFTDENDETIKIVTQEKAESYGVDVYILPPNNKGYGYTLPAVNMVGERRMRFKVVCDGHHHYEDIVIVYQVLNYSGYGDMYCPDGGSGDAPSYDVTVLSFVDGDFDGVSYAPTTVAPISTPPFFSVGYVNTCILIAVVVSSVQPIDYTINVTTGGLGIPEGLATKAFVGGALTILTGLSTFGFSNDILLGVSVTAVPGTTSMYFYS